MFSQFQFSYFKFKENMFELKQFLRYLEKFTKLNDYFWRALAAKGGN